MGTWGTGVFENDRAADLRDEIIESLRKAIEQDLARAETDAVLERPTVAAVRCLRVVVIGTLDSAEERAGYVPLVEVQRWRETYLDWFDRNMPLAGAEPSVLAGLRRTVVEEFDRLIAVLEAPREST